MLLNESEYAVGRDHDPAGVLHVRVQDQSERRQRDCDGKRIAHCASAETGRAAFDAEADRLVNTEALPRAIPIYALLRHKRHPILLLISILIISVVVAVQEQERTSSEERCARIRQRRSKSAAARSDCGRGQAGRAAQPRRKHGDSADGHR